MKTLAWLVGLRDFESVDSVQFALSAPWVRGAEFWLLLGCLACVFVGLSFYMRSQRRGPAWVRTCLGFARGILLALLLLTLAAPVIRIAGRRIEAPVLYLAFDGTESMELSDDYTPDFNSKLAESTGVDPTSATRRELLQGWLRQDGSQWLEHFRNRGIVVEPFVFDGDTTSHLRSLRSNAGTDFDADSYPSSTSTPPTSSTSERGDDSLSDTWDGAQLAERLTATGQVTEIGAVLHDAQRQLGAGRMAGLVVFSDFAHNGSVAPLGVSGPVSKFAAPVHTVGLGATQAVDAMVELQTDPKMKRAERTVLTARITQTGLTGQSAVVSVTSRQLSGEGVIKEVGRQTVVLEERIALVEFPYTPQASGEFEFVARVEPLASEATAANNEFTRQTKVIDDYLRLFYAAFEPTWEWHFVKEVFHRDKLVGMDGFRTFLSSSDPKVRQSNVLFLPSLTPPRSEFFKNDVIFLDDMPRAAISNRFSELAQEFVGEHGGGLVVIIGPRFGPRQLVGTPLADMLPVTIDPNAKLQDDREFALQRSPAAARYPFMTLGDSPAEDALAWENLGALPFYQPVLGVHEQATVLAEHPTDVCQDGRTKQPLIAVRPYGRGEVVYLGFNETWRLRRRYGEKYYRRLWSQLIYRLGMSHALGADKRFRVEVNGQQFRPDDEVTLTIEAYDEDYEPLSPDDLPTGGMAVRIQSDKEGVVETRETTATFLRNGLYEARFPVYDGGQYILSVTDPITGEAQRRRFEVVQVSAEQQRVVRNEYLQTELAQATGGVSIDLTKMSRLLEAVDVKPLVEPVTRDHPLWSTPLWFSLLVGLMLAEWLARKLVHLT